MLVHLKRKPRYGVQAPLTPLIDIVFLLLIYFLLTTNFMLDEGIDVKLPQAEASKPRKRESVTVCVNADGVVFMGKQVVTLNELFEKLKGVLSGSQGKLVVIKADRTVILNKVVAVMDVAKAAGARRLCLATDKGP